jgi:hypothetical protein
MRIGISFLQTSDDFFGAGGFGFGGFTHRQDLTVKAREHEGNNNLNLSGNYLVSRVFILLWACDLLSSP